jgi:Flp pilus assembly protein TadB
MENNENLEVFLTDSSELRGTNKRYCSLVTPEEYRKEAVEYTRQELEKLEKSQQFQRYLQSKEPRFLFISLRVLILLTTIAFVISFFTYLKRQ